jgi:hypothetical protein
LNQRPLGYECETAMPGNPLILTDTPGETRSYTLVLHRRSCSQFGLFRGVVGAKRGQHSITTCSASGSRCSSGSAGMSASGWHHRVQPRRRRSLATAFRADPAVSGRRVRSLRLLETDDVCVSPMRTLSPSTMTSGQCSHDVQRVASFSMSCTSFPLDVGTHHTGSATKSSPGTQDGADASQRRVEVGRLLLQEAANVDAR